MDKQTAVSVAKRQPRTCGVKDCMCDDLSPSVVEVGRALRQFGEWAPMGWTCQHHRSGVGPRASEPICPGCGAVVWGAALIRDSILWYAEHDPDNRIVALLREAVRRKV